MIKFENPNNLELDPKLKEFFDEYKKKAVFNVVLTATTKSNATIIIYDNRINPAYLIGTVHWSGSDYVIESKSIQNDKFARWNGNYHTKTTSNLKRAVKNALEHLKPFSWDIVANRDRNEASGVLNEWIRNPEQNIHRAIGYISRQDMINEISAAIADNKEFTVSKFNEAKTVMLENTEEMQRRKELKLEAMFVAIDAFGRYVSDRWQNPKSEHELHPEIAMRLGILKMIDYEGGKFTAQKVIEEIGVKSSHTTFWLFLPNNVIVESMQ